MDKYIPKCIGKYLDRVEIVMAQVDRIVVEITQIPVAAFIIRNKESDEVKYSESRFQWIFLK